MDPIDQQPESQTETPNTSTHVGGISSNQPATPSVVATPNENLYTEPATINQNLISPQQTQSPLKSKTKVIAIVGIIFLVSAASVGAMLLRPRSGNSAKTANGKEAQSSNSNETVSNASDAKSSSGRTSTSSTQPGNVNSDACPTAFIETTKKFGTALKTNDVATINALLSPRFSKEIQDYAKINAATAIQIGYKNEIAANDLNKMDVTAILPERTNKSVCNVIYTSSASGVYVTFKVIEANGVKLIDDAAYKNDSQ